MDDARAEAGQAEGARAGRHCRTQSGGSTFGIILELNVQGLILL